MVLGDRTRVVILGKVAERPGVEVITLVSVDLGFEALPPVLLFELIVKQHGGLLG
jgi:hypothetical protein